MRDCINKNKKRRDYRVKKTKNLVVAAAVFLTGISHGEVVQYTASQNWSGQTVNLEDVVIISRDAVVVLDRDVTVAQIRVNNTPAPSTGTLVIDQKFSLAVTDKLELGMNTGAGTIRQSAGRVSAKLLIINTSGAGDVSGYEISGGTLSTLGGLVLRPNGQLTVIGNAATIQLNNLSASGGTFRFELGQEGISLIDVQTGNIDLSSAAIVVDGSAYTGPGGTFDLIRSRPRKMSGAADSSTGGTGIRITGFSASYTATVTQSGGVLRLTVVPVAASVQPGTAG